MHTIQVMKVGEFRVPRPEIYYQGAFEKWPTLHS